MVLTSHDQPGGHAFYNSGKPNASVCHSPGVVVHLTYQGAPLVEDERLRLGAIFEKMANGQPFSVTDGLLITGQNPASSTSAAQALLKLITQQTGRVTATS